MFWALKWLGHVMESLLSHRKYVLDLLSETGMLGSKTIDPPMDSNTKLMADHGELLTDSG